MAHPVRRLRKLRERASGYLTGLREAVSLCKVECLTWLCLELRDAGWQVDTRHFAAFRVLHVSPPTTAFTVEITAMRHDGVWTFIVTSPDQPGPLITTPCIPIDHAATHINHALTTHLTTYLDSRHDARSDP